MTDLPSILSLEQFETEALKATSAPEYQSKFRAVRWSDLDAPGPEHEWLVKNVLTRGERAMMVGASQSGKSFLAIDLAMSIARGVPWFGNKTMRGGIVYQAGEGSRGIRKRLRAYRIEHGISLSDPIPFVLLPATVDLYAGGDAAAAALIEEIKHWAGTYDCPLELVVIDTFAAATPGADENSSKDVGPVLARCERIALECKCAVMLVHHMNAGGQKPRGHTSILANLDSVLTVAETEVMDTDKRKIREVETAKQKDGESHKRWRFVLPAVEVDRDGDGDPVTSCVVRAPNIDGEPGETAKPTDAGIRLTAQGEILLRSIYRALSESGEEAPEVLGLPPGTAVVRWKAVAEIFAKMAFDGETETDPKKRADKVSQAMKRHGERLMQQRIIMRENPYMWLTGRKVRGFGNRPDSVASREKAAEREQNPPENDASPF